MQHPLSLVTGATTMGLPRRRGVNCCSAEAKYELKSTYSVVRPILTTR